MAVPYVLSVAAGIFPAVESGILPGGFGSANREITGVALAELCRVVVRSPKRSAHQAQTS